MRHQVQEGVVSRAFFKTVAALGALLLTAPTTFAAPRSRAPEDEIAPPGAKYKPVTIITPDDMVKQIAAHKGRAVVLQLWATWCLPCLEELPIVAAFARDMRAKGVEVVSISLDDPSVPAAWKVGRILHEKTGSKLPSSIVKIDDPDKFIGIIDPRWDGDIPALFAYDRTGKKRRAFVGEVKRADLDKLVADLIAPVTP